MLYSRVRSDRNQLGNSGAGNGTGSASGTAAGGTSSAPSDGTSGSARSSSLAAGGASSGVGASASNPERDSFCRWRDRQYYGPRRWYQSSREEAQWEKDNGKSKFISFINDKNDSIL